MSNEIKLTATRRDERGKNAIRRMRAAGLVPVTVYGSGTEATSSSIVKREFAALVRAHGRNKIISLNLDGAVTPVKVAELQLDPVKGTLLHIDLIRISMTEKTNFDVPVRLTGESDGVRNFDGVMDFVTHMLTIRCLPGDLPEEITVDVSPLGVGQHVSVKDLSIDEKIEILNDPETVICTVAAPRVVEETVEVEAAAEPEVIKKGKAEEE
ncbi:MAG: 50S ribosomal protein L25 [Acidobacteriota bacterium]|nr:MAG: 50S ribosomal protein L25 [Acidobacteriota bacterium]